MAVRLRTDVPDEEVLRRATKVFSSVGFEGATMREIADEARIRQADLFARFPSKEEILWLIAYKAHRFIIEGQADAFSGGKDTVDRFRRFIRFHSSFHAEQHDVALIVNQNMSSLSLDHRVEAVRLRDLYDHRFRELLERGVLEGQFDITNLRVTAYAILEMGIEISVWYRPQGELSVEELSALHEELALRMVGYC